jgi:hypothetical protein
VQMAMEIGTVVLYSSYVCVNTVER